MNKDITNKVAGLIGFGVGMIGIGYAVGTKSKMEKIADKLDKSIDELSNDAPIDISDTVVKEAVRKAAEKEVRYTVRKITETETRKQVSAIVDSEYSNIKDAVLTEVTNSAAKIDVNRVRGEVEKAAKAQALKKFDDNLDEIMTDYKNNLSNVTKIYKSFADAAVPSPKETVLKIAQ